MVKLEVRGPRVEFEFEPELTEQRLSLMHLDMWSTMLVNLDNFIDSFIKSNEKSSIDARMNKQGGQ
jgi:hypothetical protein